MKQLFGTLLLAMTVAAVELPVSFDKVWFRPGERGGFGGAKHGGFLTVSDEAVEFTSKKEAFAWPWEKLTYISKQPMRGDVDTDWVVLGVRQPDGSVRNIGLRDGRRLGYGEKTQAIYNTIRAAMEQVGAGPWDLQPGWKLFDTTIAQFTVSLPESWMVFHASQEFVDGRLLHGESWFGLGFEDAAPTEGDALLLRREASPSPVACHSKKQEKAVAAVTERLTAALEPWAWVQSPTAEPITVDRCDGWSWKGTVADGDRRQELRAVAVSDDQTLFLWIGFGESLPFDDVVGTVRFALGS